MREKPRLIVESLENCVLERKNPPYFRAGGVNKSDVYPDLSPRRTPLHHCHQNNYFAARVGIEHLV